MLVLSFGVALHFIYLPQSAKNGSGGGDEDIDEMAQDEGIVAAYIFGWVRNNISGNLINFH